MENEKSWVSAISTEDLRTLLELETLIESTFTHETVEGLESTWFLPSGPWLSSEKNGQITAINLSFCSIEHLGKIADVLKKLPHLVTLLLSNNCITDLTPLTLLPRLQHLDVSRNRIIDPKPLSSLTALRELEISNNEIVELWPLSGLVNLEYLGAGENQIGSIMQLDRLTRLHTLYLNNNRIENAGPLAALTRLTSLYLNCNRLHDLTPLANLTRLETLRVDNLPYVSDFSPLLKLEQLQYVNLSSTQIKDLNFLANAKKLQSLYLRHTRLTRFDEQLLAHFPKLEDLSLEGSPLENIPQAILADYNCLEDVKNYFRDSKQGQTASYEAKIILIGNGRVGKTSLVKRWLNNTFDAEEPSTHAIQLRPWPLPELAKQLQLQHIRLNIWDFGGQDIYHATHRTFMHTEAVFLLVWDAETETIPEFSETLPGGKIIKYKNYPLEYWLSYIKVLSNNSPVILVQTHRNRDKQKLTILTEAQQKEYNVKAMLAIESSTATANGFEALKEQVQEIIVEQIQHTSTSIPASWVHIRARIAQLQEEQQVRHLALSTFEALCNGENLDEGSIKTLLRYFHNTGIFFYREGLFNDQIVIDQKWAIDAIYTLFDRKGSFARLHQNGRFTQEDLREYWQQYNSEEQHLFLDFMLQCEICFVAGKPINWDTVRKEIEYIAPQLLPEAPPLSVQALRRHGNGLHYKYRHRFLHTAIIQRFTVRTGYLANENDLWQSGTVLSTDQGMALIEAFPKQNEIVIRLDTIDQRPLLNKIRNEMKKINGDEAGIEELVSSDGINFVHLEQLKKRPEGNESIQAENGNWIKADTLAIFLDISDKEVFTPKPRKKRIKIPQLIKVRAELQKEVDNKCPFCGNEDVGHLEIHHIDENPGNNNMSNLLLVCPTCHSKIDKGDIKKETVIQKKTSLQKP